MKVLAWRKGGVNAVLLGMRNTKTGELRELTAEERASFIRDFKGVELLEEPITEREQ